MPLTKENEEQLCSVIKDFVERLKSNDATGMLIFEEEKLKKVLEVYKSGRDHIKRYMKMPEKDDKRIDRHKMAATLVASIMHIKPLYSVKTSEKIQKIVKNYNIYLAIFVAINIMEDFYIKEHNGKILNLQPTKRYLDELRKLLFINYNLIDNCISSLHGIQLLFFISHLFYWLDKGDRDSGTDTFHP